MKNNNNNQTTSITMVLQQLRDEIASSRTELQKARILEDSPYSEVINEYISNYREFYLYYTLKLQEAEVTRPSLIKDIDFDLWVTSEEATNYELMVKGKPPYAYDEPDGIIEIHHIGQDFNAPFAELTQREHVLYGNNKVFHTSQTESWRNDKKKLSLFNKERTQYWKLRAAKKLTINKEIEFKEIEERQFLLPEELQEEIADTVETLFNECSTENLLYLSDLAKSYSLIKEAGSSSIDEFIANSTDGRKIICTRCDSDEYISFGYYSTVSERIQRYKCKKCGRIFTATSKSLISNSQFSFVDWIKFIDCLYNGYSVKKTARVCGISESTVHSNRIKLFYALKLLDDKVQLQGKIAMDETFYPVSFKGNHSNEEGDVMPREAHERGHENHEKGITDNHVCIVCALDDNGNSVARIVGTGNSSAKKISNIMLSCINKKNTDCLYTDKSNALKKFAEENELDIVQIKAIHSHDKKPRKYNPTAVKNLQRINSYHSRLKRFLNNFSGISTKYLSGYLYLFAWKERNKEKNPVDMYKELLGILIEPNLYVSVEEITGKGYLPDALTINNKKRIRQDALDREEEMYDRWSKGESMTKIGKDFGISRQRVHQSIDRYRDRGLAYKTERQKKREEKENIAKKRKDEKRISRLMAVKSLEDAIYHDYLTMVDPTKNDGSQARFLEYVSQKYNISIRKINDTLATAKRNKEIAETIPFSAYFTMPSLEDIYKEIYTDYVKTKEQFPDKENHIIVADVAETTNTSMYTVYAVVNSMERPDFNGTFYSPRRILPFESIKRNTALFGEYVRFTGDKKDFYKYVEEKYDLLYETTFRIIESVLLAYPEKFDMLI